MTANELTVIVPVFNRAESIAKVIDDVAEQTVLPDQLIIVDDGSTDNTRSIIEHKKQSLEGRLTIDIIKGEHRGACAARNAGLKAVTTKWTMFFDSDDRMAPNHIASAMSAVSDHAEIVGWDVERISLDGQRRLLRFETDDIEWHNVMHGTLSTQRYMARTELFRRVGGWNEGLRIWVDIELGARMLRALSGSVVKAVTDHPTVTIIAGEQSITGQTWASRANRYADSLRALQNALSPQNSDWIDLKQAILAADIARETKKRNNRFKVLPTSKAAVKFAYRYRRAGGRGAARLLRRFFSVAAGPAEFPDLTVVVPVYNRADRVASTLDSIAAQTCLPGRVIVVDDGSTDGSSDAVSRWIAENPLGKRFELIRAQHGGAAASRNVGLDTVTTRWTMFFDSDDTMEPGHIALARSGVSDDVDIVGWNALNHRRNGSRCLFKFHRRDRLWNNLMHGTFGTQRYMARTSLFRKVGGWNPDAVVWNDIELGTRLLALNPRIKTIKSSKPTVNMYAGDNSLTWVADDRASRYAPALRAMHNAGVYPESWLKLKAALIAADLGRGNAEKGKRMFKNIPNPGRAVRLAYFYRYHGGRATARLLRMFFRNPKRP